MWPKTRTRSSLQWALFIISCIACTKVTIGVVTLQCTPSMTITAFENVDITVPVATCTTDGDTVAFKNQNPGGTFDIQNNGGSWDLMFNSQPDFEIVNQLSVTLQASKTGTDFSGPITLNVIILDVDDNPPIFKDSSLTVPIHENTMSDITQLSITDKDGSTSYDESTVVFSWSGDNGDYGGTFELSPLPVQNKVAPVVIKLLKPLDYENIVSYSLTITATDSGGLSNEAGVVVNVVDEEDTPPYFNLIAPYTEIPESQAIGTKVFTVTAMDGDRGNNYPVKYSITAGNTNNDFTINADTGEVTVANPLDRDDSTSIYVLTITATEQPTSMRSAAGAETTTTCTISLTDVDDCAPTFSFSTYTATVIENSPIDSVVSFQLNKQIVITDHDQGDNAIFNVTLDDPSGAFSITPASGASMETFSLVVVDSSVLDFETTPTIDVTIIATDFLDPSLTSTTVVTVTVQDANDVPPVITVIDCTDTYEDATVGTQLCTVVVTQNDAKYQTMKYSGNFGQLEGKIDIDPLSGVISVIADKSFDYEMAQSYVFTVIATNDNGAGLTASNDTMLKILDVNDNDPYYQPSTYTMVLYEDQSDFTVPLILQATDKDDTINGELTFAITQGQDQFELGTLTSDNKIFSQIIKPTAAIDFESLTGCSSSDGCPINVLVQASDKGTPSRSATATVTIILMDTNDNAPVFDQLSYSGQVLETDVAGTVVTTVSATDADATTEYNTVTFRLENDGAANFVVDKVTGIITVSPAAKLNPDLYSPPKYFYNLTVYANDNGGHDVPCTVTVDLQDVNNQAPAFIDNGMFATHFLETYNVFSTPIYTVVADDVDLNNQLSYSINFTDSKAQDKNGLILDIDLTKYFNIDEVSGQVFLLIIADRETLDSATLSLMVVDTNTDAEFMDKSSDTGQLFIQIDDVNDCTPIFTYGNYNGIVAEGDYEADTIVSMDNPILATDNDKDFGTVSYFIESSTSTGFTIDVNTGMLAVAASTKLDYETEQYVLLTIKAKDNGPNPPLSSTATVNVSITNVNDNNPIFDSQSYGFDYTETSQTPFDVGLVSATDADLGVYGDVVYNFAWTEGDYHDLFQVNAATGKVVVTTDIDYDSGPTKYSMQMEAIDNFNSGQGKSNTATVPVTITILPYNDNSPQIDEVPGCPTVQEVAAAGTLIIQITATDIDSGPDGKLTYTLEDDNNWFTISDTTQFVSVVGDLVNHVGPTYVLVVVCDHGVDPGPLCANQTLCINITDVNNNPPYITDPDPKQELYAQAYNCTQEEDIVATIQYDDDDIYDENKLSTFSMRSWCFNGTQSGTTGPFRVDPNTGDIILTDRLDKAICIQYRLEVTVTNTNDISQTGSKNFTLSVDKCSDNMAEFMANETKPICDMYENCTPLTCDICHLPTPFDVDFSEGEIPKPIYCYIVDGNSTEYFDVNSTECTVQYIGPDGMFDYESPQKQYQLVIVASEWEKPDYSIPYDDRNNSLALLTIKINDTNDNYPYFDPSPFYTGVSYDNVIGETIDTLVAKDVDITDVGQLTYSQGEITIEDKANMATVPTDCVRVDTATGDIILEYSFNDGMTGYVMFTAYVTDSQGLHTNETNVKIYVVSSNEKLVCFATTSVKDFQDLTTDFENDFSAVTGYIVVVDSLKPHAGADGNPIDQQCDIYLHMVDQNYNILSATEALDVVGQNSAEINNVLFPKYNIWRIQSYLQTPASSNDNIVQIVLLAVAVVLAVVCVALILLSIYTSRKMKRKLKAATAPAFGSQRSLDNRMEVPNSNLHAVEGSNPIWNAATDVDKMQFERQYDEMSDNASRTSSLHDIRADDKFEGGLNNPSFEQRIEKMFMDNHLPDYDRDSDNNSVAFSFVNDPMESPKDSPMDSPYDDHYHNPMNMDL